jgi:ribosomal protein S18 acetylase RimI-like enzyme
VPASPRWSTSSPTRASSIRASRTWRRADLADSGLIARVLEVQHAAYAIEAQLIGYADLPPAHETIAELQASREELWLCEQDGELVGAVGLERSAAELLIARLFVAPTAFRRGIGTALVRHALEQANGRPVRVGTAAANAPALALYEGLGFRQDREHQPAPGLRYLELVRDP